MSIKKVFSILSLISFSSFLYFGFYRPLPKRTGELQLPILESEVSVTYDNYGIPHIEAGNEKDALRSLGFVIAQDRLFQWEVQRRLAKGELSEIFGEATLEVDKFFRNLGFKRHADDLVQNQIFSKESMDAAQAFLDGVNYFIKNRPLPTELQLLRVKPKPFTVSDIVAFSGYMSFSFQEAMKIDPLFPQLKNQLGPKKFQEFYDAYEYDGPAIDQSIGYGKSRRSTSSQYSSNVDFSIWNKVEKIAKQISPRFEGSNSWVLSGKRTISGYPILANDPHISYSNPGVWYEAHVVYPGHEIYGHYLSFIPFPVLGHTLNHAWALTMSEIDDMDFFVEKRTGNKVQRSEGIFEDLKVHSEQIKIKGKSITEKVDYYSSSNGPLLTHVLPTDELFPIALKWAFYSKKNKSLDAFYKMGKARNLQEFRYALSLLGAPGLNISYVDNAGNIAWTAAGFIPNRPKGVDSLSLLYGFNPDHQYNSYLPFNFNPALINPSNAMIVTANHLASNSRRDTIAGYWQPSDRGREIIRQLNLKEKWSAKDLKVLMHDNTVNFWPKAKSLLLGSISKSKHPEKERLYSLMYNWDGKASKSSIEMTIYRTWERFISKQAMVDELGEDTYKEIFKSPYRYNMYKFLIQSPLSSWWDDVRTREIENYESILESSLIAATEFLSKKLGSDINQWQWSKLHSLELVHPLGRNKPLNKVFNIGPVGIDGGYSIINAQGARNTHEDFKVGMGPSTRRIIDMANPRLSFGILPSGNSGHLLDKHHRDQFELFTNGKMRDQIMDMEYIREKYPENLLLFP